MTRQTDHRAGIVATRLSGTDGVSLETAKWTAVLERLGIRSFFFAGLLDTPAAVSRLVPEANFLHPEIDRINRAVFNPPTTAESRPEAENSDDMTIVRRDSFSPYIRPARLDRHIFELRAHLRDELYAFAGSFDLDFLVVENALAIPLNIPLGLAITDFVAQTGIPVVAHHHDLAWERQRFAVNRVPDYIAGAFPPPLPSIRHVVLNSVQAQQLAWRHGLPSRVIPNVMDFDCEPNPLDDYALRARRDLGVGDGEVLVLQPTRIIQRKGIEHAIELVRRLGIPAKLVVSHAGDDEDGDYQQRVREFARLLDVPVRFESEIVGCRRGRTADGRPVYALADVYPQADLVTYPSSIEGFGNAFLEAIYYRRPLVVNRYSVYEIDIKPKGFRVVEFDNYISESTVREARELIRDPARARQLADINFDLACRHYSFKVLEKRLGALVSECLGEES